MRAVAPLTKSYIQEQFTSTSKLDDFDWRLDFKISSKNQERIKQPVLYVKMDTHDGNNEAKRQTPHQEVMF